MLLSLGKAKTLMLGSQLKLRYDITVIPTVVHYVSLPEKKLPFSYDKCCYLTASTCSAFGICHGVGNEATLALRLPLCNNLAYRITSVIHTHAAQHGTQCPLCGRFFQHLSTVFLFLPKSSVHTFLVLDQPYMGA